MSVLSPLFTWVQLTSRRFKALLFVLSAAGVWLVLAATRLGAGLTDDSFYYIKPARDLLAGHGFNPSTSFSPLLPAILLIPGLIGIDPVAGARYLHALLFGVNICLVGVITWQVSQSYQTALIAGLWVLLSENLIDAHAWVMSEPLYFTFLLLTLWSALRFYPDRGYRWLAAAGIFAGLAGLSRYAALAILPAVAIAMLTDVRVRVARRLADAAVFSVIGLIPVGAYFIRNIAVSGLATHYSRYLYVPFLKENLVWYLYNVISWLVPGRFLHGREILTGAVLAGAVLLLGIWAARRGARLHRGGLYSLVCLGGFAVMNFVMLYLARGFQELDVYNTRYLTPVLLVILILLAAGLRGLGSVTGRAGRVVITGFILIFSLYYGFRAFDYIKSAQRNGLGYANATWHNSETVTYLRQNPQLKLVGTADMGVYFWTGNLPTIISAFGGVDGLHRHLCNSGDTLLIMNQMPTNIYHVDHDQAIQGLQLVQHFNDSEMYRCTLSSE